MTFSLSLSQTSERFAIFSLPKKLLSGGEELPYPFRRWPRFWFFFSRSAYGLRLCESGGPQLKARGSIKRRKLTLNLSREARSISRASTTASAPPSSRSSASSLQTSEHSEPFMNARRKLLSLLLALPLLMTGDALNRAQPVQNFVDQQRIRFQIATVEEDGNVRRIVSLSTVEGPPGTDFDINLQDARFKMSARFLTDLVAPGALKVRTKLNTRRFYGLSPKNLPLYEEDAQAETLQLGFD